jgi:hypothetical protein
MRTGITLCETHPPRWRDCKQLGVAGLFCQHASSSRHAVHAHCQNVHFGKLAKLAHVSSHLHSGQSSPRHVRHFQLAPQSLVPQLRIHQHHSRHRARRRMLSSHKHKRHQAAHGALVRLLRRRPHHRARGRARIKTGRAARQRPGRTRRFRAVDTVRAARDPRTQRRHHVPSLKEKERESQNTVPTIRLASTCGDTLTREPPQQPDTHRDFQVLAEGLVAVASWMRGVRKTELFVAGVFGVASGYVIWKPLLDEHLLPQLQRKDASDAATRKTDDYAGGGSGGSARDASAASAASRE